MVSYVHAAEFGLSSSFDGVKKINFYSTPSARRYKRRRRLKRYSPSVYLACWSKQEQAKTDSSHKPVHFPHICARKLESEDHKRDCTQSRFHPAPGPFADEPNKEFACESILYKHRILFRTLFGTGQANSYYFHEYRTSQFLPKVFQAFEAVVRWRASYKVVVEPDGGGLVEHQRNG